MSQQKVIYFDFNLLIYEESNYFLFEKYTFIA